MSKQFYLEQFSLASVLNLKVKTVQFQAIQFSKSSHFSSIWLMDRLISWLGFMAYQPL